MQPCCFPVYNFFNESARPAGRKVKCPGHKYTLTPVPGTCFTAHFPALPPARHTQLHSFSSAKASLMSLCVSVWIYAREREWVYGYEWACGACVCAHTHTHTMWKKAFPTQGHQPLVPVLFPFLPGHVAALSPTFFLSPQAFPICPPPFEAFRRHLYILSISRSEALLCKSLNMAQV